MEPTVRFLPFGPSGPKVALFGKQTGDWNLSRFNGSPNLDCSGLYFRLNQISEEIGFKELYAPLATSCNGLIVLPRDFTQDNSYNLGVNVKRGVEADGTVILQGAAGAIASADCPTIIAHCHVVRLTIIAHGGAKSLIGATRPFTEFKMPSVVQEVVSKMEQLGFRYPQVFVTCGIRHYEWPELAQYCQKNWPDAVLDEKAVDLRILIARQFTTYSNINNVMIDTHDTLTETDSNSGDYRWYSYRRDKSPGRNLVLVVNK